MGPRPPIAVAPLFWREEGLKHWEVNWLPRWDKVWRLLWFFSLYLCFAILSQIKSTTFNTPPPHLHVKLSWPQPKEQILEAPIKVFETVPANIWQHLTTFTGSMDLPSNWNGCEVHVVTLMKFTFPAHSAWTLSSPAHNFSYACIYLRGIRAVRVESALSYFRSS